MQAADGQTAKVLADADDDVEYLTDADRFGGVNVFEDEDCEDCRVSEVGDA